MSESPTFAAAPGLEDFRAEVREWLNAELADGGPFADVRGTGGPGREHETLDRRREWERRLGEGGWIGLGWPVAVGGRGLSLAHQVVFHEEYARAGGPGRLMHMSEQLLAPTLIAFGTPEQQAEHLPGILRGETLWCQGYSEPGAGSDLAGVATKATRDGDGDDAAYVITGQKVWTSLAHVADWCFVLARTEAGSGRHAGLSFLLVPMDQPGIDVRPIVQITGTSEFNEVFFDGARCPVTNRVGAEGDGWRIAMALLGFERGVSTLGQQVGFEREYAAVRAAAVAAGLVDGRGQPMGLRSAALAVRLEQSRLDLLVLRAVAESTLRSSGEGTSGLEASISKLLWATWHRDLGELAIDIAGSPGVVLDGADGELSEAQSLFLFTRSDTIYGGSNEIQRNLLAERLLGMPREGSPGATTPTTLGPEWDPSGVLLTGEATAEIREAVRGVLDEVAPRPTRGFAQDVQRALVEDLGVGLLCVPEVAGGLGLARPEAGVIAWEHGTHLASTALVGTLAAAGWLAEVGGPVAARYAVEQPLVAVVVPEPGATVDDQGDLTGTARLVPWATRADWLLVVVDEGVWLVERSAEGLSVEARSTLDPTLELAEVHFDGVSASLVDPSGGQPEGGPAKVGADLLLARWRSLVALEASGTAYRALMDVVGYLGERRQFGRTLASYQAIKHRCADLVTRVAGSTALAAQALSRPELASDALTVAADALMAVAADALQLHGGVGFTDEFDVHLALKRGKTLQALHSSLG